MQFFSSPVIHDIQSHMPEQKLSRLYAFSAYAGKSISPKNPDLGIFSSPPRKGPQNPPQASQLRRHRRMDSPSCADSRRHTGHYRARPSCRRYCPRWCPGTQSRTPPTHLRCCPAQRRRVEAQPCCCWWLGPWYRNRLPVCWGEWPRRERCRGLVVFVRN